MLGLVSFLSILVPSFFHLAYTHPSQDIHHYNHHRNTTDPIPFSVRAFWMRKANSVLSELVSPCPFGAFGTVVVNHSDLSTSPMGKLVCIGVNQNAKTGNPTLHGEIAAINNCTTILTDPVGEYKLSPSEASKAFEKLSLYTNAESCPMCASAIRWAGLAEYIYGTTIERLIETGWGQISISSKEVFYQSTDLGTYTRLIPRVLTNETDPYFLWQFNTSYPCPSNCGRTSDESICMPGLEKKVTVVHEL